MGFNYLEEIEWGEITREERFFTCVLFNDFQQSHQKTRKFLGRTVGSKDKEGILSIVQAPGKIEIGYEVCLYRDFLKRFKPKGNLAKKVFSDKRTFDLCIFSQGGILIIEAKAQQGYCEKQLKDIRQDRKLIKDMLGIPEDKVKIISLHSSLYKPRKTTLDSFDGFLTWDSVAKEYNENRSVYDRADSIYRK